MGKYGYGVVKKAYKAALVQNMMRAGGTLYKQCAY